MGQALHTSQPNRLLRLPEVMQRVPLARSTIYARMDRGEFPRARSLGGNVVAWLESDISAWIESCPLSDAGHDNDG